MRIILIRHAKSSWAHEGLTDFERPLNGRGRNAAPLMGQKLNKHGLAFDQVFSSPSKRTRQTIKRICQEIAYDYADVAFEDSLYHASTDGILDVIHEVYSDKECIAFVIHNPSITDLANLLQKDMYIPNVPTCGIVSISFEVEEWLNIGENTGTLDFFDYPKKDQ